MHSRAIIVTHYKSYFQENRSLRHSHVRLLCFTLIMVENKWGDGVSGYGLWTFFHKVATDYLTWLYLVVKSFTGNINYWSLVTVKQVVTKYSNIWPENTLGGLQCGRYQQVVYVKVINTGLTVGLYCCT